MTMQMPPMFRSEPIKCQWLGWESDTFRLQQHGWQISADQAHLHDGMAIAIKFPEAPYYGISEYMRPEFMSYEVSQMGHNDRLRWLAKRGVHFRMSLANHIQIEHMGNVPSFVPIDATPVVDMEGKIMRLDEMKWFHPIPKEEVVVEPPSFDDILKMALDHQAPKQKELREKARRQLQNRSAIIRVAV